MTRTRHLLPLCLLCLFLIAVVVPSCSSGDDDDRPPVSDDDDDSTDDDDNDDDDDGDDDSTDDLEFQGLAVGAMVDNTAVIAALSDDQWISVELPDSLAAVSLFGCEIPEANRAWIVGEDIVNRVGKILYYNGSQWRDVTPPGLDADWYLRGIDVVDTTHAWAVGYDETNNRGVTLNYEAGVWNFIWPQEIDGDWSFNDVHFPTSLEGYIVGRKHYDDDTYAGHVVADIWGTWQILPPLYFADRWYLTSVHFSDTLNGWIGGRDLDAGQPVLLRYWEGSWAALEPPEVDGVWWIQDIDCNPDLECVAVGSETTNLDGVVLRSNVSGTWSVWNTGELLHREYWDLWAAEYDADNEVWYAAGSYDADNQKGLVIRNNSGGYGWTQDPTPAMPKAYYFVDLCMTPTTDAR